MLNENNEDRRFFKIKVGNIPKENIEDYIKGIAKRFKSPIVNTETGEIDLRGIDMSNISQDIWIPAPTLSDTEKTGQFKTFVSKEEKVHPTPMTTEDIEELDKLHGITKNNENTKKLSVFDKLSKLIKK